MYKVNDYIVYRKDVCRISKIKKNGAIKYYVLNPIDDKSLTIEIPTNNTENIRDIITKEEANKLIKRINMIDIIKCDNDKLLEAEYKNLLYKGNQEDLVKIIKTTYLRNEKRIENKKRISEKDDNYFKLAEKYLYNELGLALNMTFNEIKEYIKKIVVKTLE